MKPIVTRTYEQLYEAAMTQRQKMLRERRDPKDGFFLVTQPEKVAILDRPPFQNYELSAARDRMCGLKIMVLDVPPDPAGGSQ